MELNNRFLIGYRINVSWILILLYVLTVVVLPRFYGGIFEVEYSTNIDEPHLARAQGDVDQEAESGATFRATHHD